VHKKYKPKSVLIDLATSINILYRPFIIDWHLGVTY